MNIDDPRFRSMAGGCVSRAHLWCELLYASGAKTMAEVGVWKGDFAQQVLQNCGFLERYYMIDPWANLPDWNKPMNVDARVFDHIYDEAMAKTDFAGERRVVLRGRTKDVIDEIPDGSLDFVYVDGDHTLRGITIDLARVLPKVKANGFIAGDDFTATAWQHDVSFEPTLVFPYAVYFAEAHDLPIVATPFDQFVMQKRAGIGFSFTDFTGRYGDVSLSGLLNGPV
ncbi:MAG: hypothetical protein GC138_03375 [Gammaproteobacteria bacterium]|nr:hypothetical protein [Gammaproteobacteria bacterium]